MNAYKATEVNNHKVGYDLFDQIHK